MIERVTRREMAAALLAAAPIPAQTRRDSEQRIQEEPLAAARKQVRSAILALENFDLPMAAEPAFVFKP